MASRPAPAVFTTGGARVREIDGARCVAEADDPLASLLGQLSQSGDEWATGAIPSVRELEDGNWVLITKPSPFEVQLTNGVRLLHLAADAVRGKRRYGVRLSTLLSRYFQHPYLRVPVVHDFLDHLRRQGDEKQIQVLLGVRSGARGRPPESGRLLNFVSIMNALVAGGFSAAGAARELRRLVPDARSSSEARLRNLHSELSEIAKLLEEGYFLPARYLCPFLWGAEQAAWTKFVTDTSQRES